MCVQSIALITLGKPALAANCALMLALAVEMTTNVYGITLPTQISSDFNL